MLVIRHDDGRIEKLPVFEFIGVHRLTMPFGKFKGQLVSELPTHYLIWLSEIELREPLLSAVEEVLQGRNVSEDTAPSSGLIALQVWPGDLPLIRTIFERGYRAVAVSHHPDRGGSNENMIRLNAVAEALRYQFDNAQEHA